MADLALPRSGLSLPGLLTLCGKGLSGDQEIAPYLSFWQVIPTIGQPHPGFTMQGNTPTVYFDNVVHSPPYAALFRGEDSRFVCTQVRGSRQSVREGRWTTIKLYQWA